jgi:quercetin dioxygenase-like cupin family protein
MTRTLRFLENVATIHLASDETLSGFSIVEMEGAQGNQPPLHSHRDDDEGFYVLDGKLRVWVGDRLLELEQGDYALAPHGIPHTYRVESGSARWLATSTDGFDRFVAAVGVPAEGERLPDPDDPDPERLAAIAAEHRIDLLGPPGALPAGAQ